MSFRVSMSRANEAERCLDVPVSVFSIGRGPDNEVVLPSPQVSTKHAVVESRANGVFIVDCQSRNGTFVNDELLEGERPLRPGDRVEICDFTLVIEPFAAPTIDPFAQGAVGGPEFLLGPPTLEPEPPPEPPTSEVEAAPAPGRASLWDEVQRLLGNPGVREVIVRAEGLAGARSLGTPGGWEIVAAPTRILELAATLAGPALSAEQPLLQAHLGDFTLHAYDRSVASGGPVLVFLRETARDSSLDALIAERCLSTDDAALLREAVREQRSVLVCGGTSESRHALLTALALECPEQRRRVVVHRGRLGPRLAASGLALQASDEPHEVVRAALRLRPDTLVVFELGGREIAEVLGGSRPGALLCSVPTLSARAALVTLQVALGGWLGLVAGHGAEAFAAACFDVIAVVKVGGSGGPEVAGLYDGQGAPLRERPPGRPQPLAPAEVTR